MDAPTPPFRRRNFLNCVERAVAPLRKEHSHETTPALSTAGYVPAHGARNADLTQPPSQEEAAKHKVRAVMLQTETSRASLEALAAKIEAGEIRPFVGRTYPLSTVAQAWADVRAQHMEGKIVFTVPA